MRHCRNLFAASAFERTLPRLAPWYDWPKEGDLQVPRHVRLALVVLVGLATVFPIASIRANTRIAAEGPAALDSGWNVDLVGHIGGGGGNAPLAVQAPYAYVGFGAELA